MGNGVSTLGQALDQIERLKTIQTQFSTLSSQLATGKKTQKFSGLGQDVLISKRSRADFASLEVYSNNIKNADRRINIMLNSLREFRAQSENLANALVGFMQEGTHQEGDIVLQDDPSITTDDLLNTSIGQFSGDMDADFKLLQDLSGNIFEFMVDLANVQDGERYLFSGADSKTKPLNSSSGTLNAAITGALQNWKNEALPTNITTDELIANLRQRDASANPNAFTDPIVGFSAALSAGNAGEVYARVDETKQVEYTSFANNQGFRDILVATAFLKNENLPPLADVYAEPYTFGDTPTQEGAPGETLDDQKENFYRVFNAMKQMVNNALKEVDLEIQRLESARVSIDQVRKDQTAEKTMLLNLISGAEDIDQNEIAVQINTLQVTLDASYRLTARLQELSLTNFF